MPEHITLTSEDTEQLRADIELSEFNLAELTRFERVGIDIADQRIKLTEIIKRNQSLLVEFGSTE